MIVREAGGPFILDEREIPEPEPGEIRIKVEACGICHSDAFVKFGQFPGLELPRAPGHEVAGVVDAVGEGVDAFAVGHRVGVGWHGGHCFKCNSCRRGDFINCESAKIAGISYDGGYQEYMVCPWEAAARVPDELSPAEAAPLLCAGITTYNALRNSGARPGDLVAVQGVGHVGIHLCRLLHEAGAKLLISDVNEDNLDLVTAEMPAMIVPPGELLYAEVDVLAPCALGNILTSTTIPKIHATVIAGAANNQLANAEDGARLAERDILYAPDYVINAGGIISVAGEYYGTSSEEQVRADVGRIKDRLQTIFDEAKSSGRPTNELADELARDLVAAAR